MLNAQQKQMIAAASGEFDVPLLLSQLRRDKQEMQSKADRLTRFLGYCKVTELLDNEELERIKQQNELLWHYVELLTVRIAFAQRQIIEGN